MVNWPTFGNIFANIIKEKLECIGYEQHTYVIVGNNKQNYKKFPSTPFY
jgi:hypothetical protein